ncbi:MAG: ABC transporter permease [Actinomycetota bacterium]|nr:ABC transporter permease [Actinomycetota bacterium]
MRLVNAEFLKLRKRRGLVITGLVLTVLPMLIAYTTLVIVHANNPVKNGPAGGMENFVGSMEMLTLLSAVAAILVGSTLGTGDLGAGVFRELVVTGRSRIALFAARVPAGLGLLMVIAGGAFAVTAIASTVFAGSEGPQREQVAPGAWETTHGYLAPSGALLLKSAGWLALSTAVAMVLALGVASLVGSRGTSIGILLGWWLVAMPVLQVMGVLGSLRQGIVGAAIDRIGPVPLVPSDPAVSMSVLAAVAVLAAWAVGPLAAGAWRTATRDA